MGFCGGLNINGRKKKKGENRIAGHDEDYDISSILAGYGYRCNLART